MKRNLTCLLCLLLCLALTSCGEAGSTPAANSVTTAAASTPTAPPVISAEEIDAAIAYCKVRGLLEKVTADAAFNSDMAAKVIYTLNGEEAAIAEGDTVTCDTLVSALDSDWAAPEVGNPMTCGDAAVVLMYYIQEHALPVVVETDTASTSRDGVDIPTFVTVPASYDPALKAPLTVMCHGHGGNHNEWGGFDAISGGLAANGILVVTMDYPGCGISAEPFTANTLTNMKHDTVDVLNAVITDYNADPDSIAFFGYSMGGRITLELLAEEAVSVKAVNLVAPAADSEDLKALFGGADTWDDKKAAAQQNGFFLWTTVYGQKQALSYDWFLDLEVYADGLAEKAAAKYHGPAQVIWATDDEAVSPAVSAHVAQVLDAAVLNTHTDGHSYSFYGTDPDTISTVNDGTIAFLTTQLLQGE